VSLSISRYVTLEATDLEDRDKVSAVIDSLIDYHNDFNYADNVNPCMYLDTGIYAIIDDCGFGL
jgi:hypothetical protein